MSDNFGEYLNFLSQIWHRRWIVLPVAIVICAIGWPVVAVLPDQYEVSAKVNVDTQTILKPLLQGLAVDADITQQTAAVLQRTLLTRPNLVKIARATDLDLSVKTPAEFERLILDLSKKIQISPVASGLANSDRRNQPTQQVYVVSYVNSNPQRAKDVVDAVLNLFVEGILGATRKDTSLTQEFLDKEIRDYEVKLEEAETRLKEFKQQNIGLMPSEGVTYYSQRSTLTDRLAGSRLELDEAVRRRDELRRQINEVVASAKNSNVVQSEVELSPIDARIQAMSKKLDELLLQYTEEHPDVVSARRVLADLQQQKKKDAVADTTSSQESRLLETNRAYQELKIALGEQEAQVAALTVRVEMHKKSVDHLNTMIDTVPRVEAELAKLNRDYSVLHDNHKELMKRRESARLSFEAGDNPEDVQFNVIDPPRVPLAPVGPNRLLFFTGVMLAGFGAGVGLVLLLLQLKPTFTDGRSLLEKTGIPVFGAVTLVLTKHDVTKERVSVALFGLVTLVLLSIYAGLVAMQLLHIKL